MTDRETAKTQLKRSFKGLFIAHDADSLHAKTIASWQYFPLIMHITIQLMNESETSISEHPSHYDI